MGTAFGMASDSVGGMGKNQWGEFGNLVQMEGKGKLNFDASDKIDKYYYYLVQLV